MSRDTAPAPAPGHDAGEVLPGSPGRDVKLIVWDLDGTLWEGTLAEDAEVRPDAGFLALIQALLDRGIVHSVASKNDPAEALARLAAFGLREAFVFPKIALRNKGALVAETLRAMNLRAENVLFVDDNPFDRREVAHGNPGLMAVAPEELRRLPWAGWGAPDPARTRLAQYRLLEAREGARSEALGQGTPERAFLQQSRIELTFVPLDPGDVDLVVRAVALANRANQLNFTRSRFHNEHHLLTGALRQGENWALFLRDRYGDYGMVGFASVRGGALRHFVFSCRVLGMGAEAAAFRWLAAREPRLRTAFGRALRRRLERAPSDHVQVREGPGRTLRGSADGGPSVLLRGSCFMRAISGSLEARYGISEEIALGGQGTTLWELRQHAEGGRRLPPELCRHATRALDREVRAFDALVLFTEVDVFGALFRRGAEVRMAFAFYALDAEDWAGLGASPLFQAYLEDLVGSLDRDTFQEDSEPLERALHGLARLLPTAARRRVFRWLLLRFRPRRLGTFEGLLAPEAYADLLAWLAGRVHPATALVFLALPEDLDLPLADAATNGRLRARIRAMNGVLRDFAAREHRARLVETTGLLNPEDLEDAYGHLRKSGYHKVQLALVAALGAAVRKGDRGGA